MIYEPGDILIIHANDPAGTGHTAMALSKTRGVHADPVASGVVRDDLDVITDDSKDVQAFRCLNTTVARTAVELATRWSVEDGKTPTTRFSASTDPSQTTKSGMLEARVLGVTEAGKNPQYLDFGYDALYRVFKWAANAGEKPFTRSAGQRVARSSRPATKPHAPARLFQARPFPKSWTILKRSVIRSFRPISVSMSSTSAQDRGRSWGGVRSHSTPIPEVVAAWTKHGMRY